MTTSPKIFLFVSLLLSLLGQLEANFARLRVLKPRHKRLHQAATGPTTAADGADEQITTEVGKVVDAFIPLLGPGGANQGDEALADISIPQLLQACRIFQTQMERVGQARSSRDLLGNIRKVETLYDVAPADARDSLVRLLRFERGLGVHPPAGSGVLRDPSGAIGLLWIRRSLAFQTAWYRRLLEDPNGDVTEAARDAYRRELQPFHGYFLQNIFLGVGIPAMTPPRPQLLARLGGFREDSMTASQRRATERDLRRLVGVWDPLVARWTAIMREMDMEDYRRI